MPTAFFSHPLTRQAGSKRERPARGPDPDGPVLEQQQALLMQILQRADGAPVSYAELNDAGVEFPASVVSELELAGVAIERCFGRGTGSRRVLGVRLVPASDPDTGPVGAGAAGPPISEGLPRTDWEPVRIYRTSRARTLLEATLAGAAGLGATGRRWAGRAAAGRPAIGSRMLALLALLVAAGVVVVVVVTAQPGSGGRPVRAARARHHPPTVAQRHVIARRPGEVTATRASGTRRSSTPAGSRTTSSTATTGPPTTVTPKTSTQTTPAPARHTALAPVSPPLAAGLEARGHDLMVAGRYHQAVPVLRRALAATGERPGACSEPTTQTCLTYAFALYDLGRSLRLAGRPAAAVRVLKHRLRINNQRRVVAAELVRARQQAKQRSR